MSPKLVGGKKHTKQWLAKMDAAAQMRAAGCQWTEVAERLGYSSAKTARDTMTQSDRELWAEKFGEAIEVAMQAGIEATAVTFQQDLVLRGMETAEELRSNPPEEADVYHAMTNFLKVCQSAAHSLQVHIAKLRGHKVKFEGELGIYQKVDDELLRRAREDAERLALPPGPEDD